MPIGKDSPAGMFIGVRQRQERQENLVFPAKILGQDAGRAIDVAQDRAVMSDHPAWRAAGAAGIDDAGQIIAPMAAMRASTAVRAAAASPRISLSQ